MTNEKTHTFINIRSTCKILDHFKICPVGLFLCWGRYQIQLNHRKYILKIYFEWSLQRARIYLGRYARCHFLLELFMHGRWCYISWVGGYKVFGYLILNKLLLINHLQNNENLITLDIIITQFGSSFNCNVGIRRKYVPERFCKAYKLLSLYFGATWPLTYQKLGIPLVWQTKFKQRLQN